MTASSNRCPTLLEHLVVMVSYPLIHEQTPAMGLLKGWISPSLGQILYEQLDFLTRKDMFQRKKAPPTETFVD